MVLTALNLSELAATELLKSISLRLFLVTSRPSVVLAVEKPDYYNACSLLVEPLNR